MKIDEKTIKEIFIFRDDRNWKQFHNPKDLAISLSIESAELLECFQWSTSKDSMTMKSQSIKEELADVLIYSILFAEAMGLDLDKTILDKIEINKKNYPVSKAYGKKDKYKELK